MKGTARHTESITRASGKGPEKQVQCRACPKAHDHLLEHVPIEACVHGLLPVIHLAGAALNTGLQGAPLGANSGTLHHLHT